MGGICQAVGGGWVGGGYMPGRRGWVGGGYMPGHRGWVGGGYMPGHSICQAVGGWVGGGYMLVGGGYILLRILGTICQADESSLGGT